MRSAITTALAVNSVGFLLFFGTSALSDNSITGNCNALGSGNSVCNIYVNQKLKYTEEIANRLLAIMPDRKPINATVIGYPAEQAVGNMYLSFLKNNGYQIVELNYIGITNMMPVTPITINIAPDHYDVEIAAGVF